MSDHIKPTCTLHELAKKFHWKSHQWYEAMGANFGFGPTRTNSPFKQSCQQSEVDKLVSCHVVSRVQIAS